MAEINVINTDEVGQGLELADGLIKAKIDPVTSNALTVSDAGLKVTVPVPAEVPVAFTDASQANNIITFTKSDGSTKNLELPAIPLDIHVTNLEFNKDGTVTMTVEGADPIVTNLTGEVVGRALLNAPDAVKNDLATMLAPLILEKLKGDKLLRINGATMGYLLAEQVA